LLAAVNRPPTVRVVVADGEDLSLEITVSWASKKLKALKVTGTAYGPSHLLTERLEEALIVPIPTRS